MPWYVWTILWLYSMTVAMMWGQAIYQQQTPPKIPIDIALKMMALDIIWPVTLIPDRYLPKWIGGSFRRSN